MRAEKRQVIATIELRILYDDDDNAIALESVTYLKDGVYPPVLEAISIVSKVVDEAWRSQLPGASVVDHDLSQEDPPK